MPKKIKNILFKNPANLKTGCFPHFTAQEIAACLKSKLNIFTQTKILRPKYNPYIKIQGRDIHPKTATIPAKTTKTSVKSPVKIKNNLKTAPINLEEKLEKATWAYRVILKPLP